MYHRHVFAVVTCSVALATLQGCSSDDRSNTDAADVSTSPATEPPPFDEDPCAHLLGGRRGAHAAASDLGRAHALARYFGPLAAPSAADVPLADALDTAEPGQANAVLAYARAAGPGSLCAAPAEAEALGLATVIDREGVAVVTPGFGDIVIPPGSKAIALDVRGLPDSDEGRAALERALVAVLHGEVVLAEAEERTCNGQPDEVWTLSFAPVDQYACKSGRTAGVKVKGTLPSPKQLAVLTAPRLTPLATRAAVDLRAHAGAVLVGESVSTTIAESQWVGIGEQGLAVRTRRLFAGGAPLPDVIQADLRAADPVVALARIDWNAERGGIAGTALRKAIGDGTRAAAWGRRADRVGDGRAALLVAYAATRTFFPYFDDVGDLIDARLDETLRLLDGDLPDLEKRRDKVRTALARFTEALQDGHASVQDKYRAMAPASPVALLAVGSELVVARSSAANAIPGDVVVSIDGMPASRRLDDALRLTSGSAHHARAFAAEDLARPGVPIVLRSPSGVTRTVTLAPAHAPVSAFGMFDRPAGTLADLGAPNVYYVSLNSFGAYAPKMEDVAQIKAAMIGKRGVVLDMRGYPDLVAWTILGHVATPNSHGPYMAELTITPASREVQGLPQQLLSEWTAARQGYTGPVVVLTGPDTQSQAEHWTSYFRSKQRGKVIGGKTSGANGTITGVQLPGGYGLTFTGMVVKHPDGTRFHALGHSPDVEVEPTKLDLRDGRDTVLARALAEL